MKFEINLNERLASIQPKLVAYPEILIQAKELIKDQLSRDVFDFFAMTVSEFLQLQENKMPISIIEILENPQTTFKTYIKILNTFEGGMTAFQSIIENTTIKASAEETMAQSGLLDMTAEETMLNFMREFFGHPNYEIAQGMSLYEYITARKVKYNADKFQQNYSKLKPLS